MQVDTQRKADGGASDGGKPLKRPYDTTDTGISTLMLCGVEVISFAGDQSNQRHLAECCDCALMNAWWKNRIATTRAAGHGSQSVSKTVGCGFESPAARQLSLAFW